jgi:hypothetical protein
MTPQHEVTRKALALVDRFSWRWLAGEINGISKVSKAVELTKTHAWTTDQATVINSRHEMLIEKIYDDQTN